MQLAAAGYRRFRSRLDEPRSRHAREERTHIVVVKERAVVRDADADLACLRSHRELVAKVARHRFVVPGVRRAEVFTQVRAYLHVEVIKRDNAVDLE